MDAHVIVVGAGPVGLMLAAELALGGADVLVLERLRRPTRESRASTLHARTMEVLDGRGLLGRLGEPPRVGTGHFGGLPLDLTGLDSPYAGLWKVPQTRVEEVLGQWAVELGAEIRRGYEVRSLSVARDHVEVSGPAGRPGLRAAFVVGCDGETSAVRRLAGIGLTGRDASRTLLRADVEGIEVPDRRFERLPNGLAIAARGPNGITRVMVHETGHPARVATFDNVVDAWRRVTGEDIGSGTPVWVNRLGDASLLADTYRDGRVLLAGDAAHRQMPVGGQAINLGLQDAANLGWKLAAEVAGRAPRGLLDSYHDERHRVGRRVLDNIEAQSALLLGGGDVQRLRGLMTDLIALPAVRDRLAAMVSGLDVRYARPDAGGHPLLGARAPLCEIATEKGTTTVAGLLRRARGLLLDLAAGPTTAPLPPHVDVVRAAPLTTGALAGVGALLVRPDGYVAGVAESAGSAGSAGSTEALSPALRTWFGVPRDTTDLVSIPTTTQERSTHAY